MAHFSQIDESGLVTNVIVVNNDVIKDGEVSFAESEQLGKGFIANDLNLPGEWVQTSYNGNFRGIYGSIGARYDRENDEFLYLEEQDA